MIVKRQEILYISASNIFFFIITNIFIMNFEVPFIFKRAWFEKNRIKSTLSQTVFEYQQDLIIKENETVSILGELFWKDYLYYGYKQISEPTPFQWSNSIWMIWQEFNWCHIFKLIFSI